jgi:hypothetical protein
MTTLNSFSTEPLSKHSKFKIIIVRLKAVKLVEAFYQQGFWPLPFGEGLGVRSNRAGKVFKYLTGQQ